MKKKNFPIIYDDGIEKIETKMQKTEAETV